VAKINLKQEQDDKFLEFLLNANEIKMKMLEGTENNESFSAVFKKQKELSLMIEDI